MPRILSFCIFQLIAACLVAQMRVSPIATTKGGPATSIATYNGYVYAGCGASLAVYDARPGKTAPYERTFVTHLGSRINDLTIRGEELYIAQHHGGISRWDLNHPEEPNPTGEFKLQGKNSPAYDISVLQDTVIVAFGDRVSVLRELHGTGPAFEFLYSFAEVGSDVGRITGGDVRGNWYACVSGWQTAYYRSALFLYNWKTGKRVHFYPRKFGNARDVVWDAKHQLLHVAGGQNPETKEGLYFAVMVGDRGGLREVYADTIPDGDALKIKRHDGKIWLTTGEGRAGTCKGGQIRLYESEDLETVRPAGFLRTINAQDIAFGKDLIHVAAASKGIRHLPPSSVVTVPCKYVPPPKITLTGAGCTGADRYEDRLVLCAPGFGMGIYDLSYDRRPVPIYHLDQAHTAQKVLFSDGGKYLYVLHKGSGGNHVEIRETESWRQVGRVYGPWGHEHMVRYEDRLYLQRDGGNGFDVVDVSRPRQPRKEHSVLMSVNDLQVDSEGRLLIANKHNVRIFDIRRGALKEILTHSSWGEGFGQIAGLAEDIVVFQPKKGLVRYSIQKEGAEMRLAEEQSIRAPHPNPTEMLSEDRGLVLGYEEHGIFVLDPEKLSRKNYLGTGFGYLDQEGVALRDLVLCENLLLVVEFFGQVTIVDTVPN